MNKTRPDGTRPDHATLRLVITDLCCHPRRLLRQWNWKSAVVSACLRASIFFAANLPSSRDAAWAAFSTEICLRLATSGFYGGLTQELGRVEPEWEGMLAAMVVLPLLSHGLELLVHALRGTPQLFISILASTCFTAISTSFNVFAMRRGALVTGRDSEPLHRDLRRMPRLIAAFVGALLAGSRRALGGRRHDSRHSSRVA